MLDPEVNLLVVHGRVEDIIDLRMRHQASFDAGVFVGLMVDVVDKGKHFHKVSNVTGTVGNQDVTVGVGDVNRISGVFLFDELHVPTVRENWMSLRNGVLTTGNGRELDIGGVLHVNVETVANEIITNVMEEQKVITLLCIVNLNTRVFGTINKILVIELLLSFYWKRVWHLPIDYGKKRKILKILVN